MSPAEEIKKIADDLEAVGPNKIVLKVEEGMDPSEILATTYQMRNFYQQMADGFFSNLDIMNYMQHQAILKYMGKGDHVLDMCCGRGLMLPLIRWYKRNIASYTGVDISKANMRAIERRSGIKDISNKPDYYPFEINLVESNVATMSDKLPDNHFDLVIYTSSIKHMQRDAGAQSLREALKVLKPGGTLFISCPNTPEKKDPYETQYAAHLYEWDLDELTQELQKASFEIQKTIGLVMKKRPMDQFFGPNGVAPEEWKTMYKMYEDYMPTAWLCAFMAIPFPEHADEVALVCTKPK